MQEKCPAMLTCPLGVIIVPIFSTEMLRVKFQTENQTKCETRARARDLLSDVVVPRPGIQIRSLAARK